METLRWILLLVGVVLVIAVYLYSRYRSGSRNPTPWRRSAYGDDDHVHEHNTDLADTDDFVDESLHQSPRFEQTGFDQFDTDVQGEPSHSMPGSAELEALDHQSIFSDASIDEPRAALRTEIHREAQKATGRQVGNDRQQHRPTTAVSGNRSPHLPDELQEKIVIFYLTSMAGRLFTGNEILSAMQAVGLEYGEKQVFHCHGKNGTDEAIFSVANLLEPGWFDMDTMDSFTTPGLVLFLQLPGPIDDLQAFDLMLDRAQQLKQLLAGELKDDSRHSLNGQMISHLRDQVQGFARKRKLTMS